jgi:hypothetical protein
MFEQDVLPFLTELRRVLGNFHTNKFATRFYIGMFDDISWKEDSSSDDKKITEDLREQYSFPKQKKLIANPKSIIYTDQNARKQKWTGPILYSWTMRPESKFQGWYKGSNPSSSSYSAQATCPMIRIIRVPREPPQKDAVYCFNEPWVHSHKTLDPEAPFEIQVTGCFADPPNESMKVNIIFVIADNTAIVLDRAVRISDYHNQLAMSKQW